MSTEIRQSLVIIGGPKILRDPYPGDQAQKVCLRQTGPEKQRTSPASHPHTE